MLAAELLTLEGLADSEHLAGEAEALGCQLAGLVMRQPILPGSVTLTKLGDAKRRAIVQRRILSQGNVFWRHCTMCPAGGRDCSSLATRKPPGGWRSRRWPIRSPS